MTNSVGWETETPTRCFLCDGPMRTLFTSQYYFPGEGDAYDFRPSVMRYCDGCDLGVREIEGGHPDLSKHFEVASYTDIAREDRWRRQRAHFFAWLRDVGLKAGGDGVTKAVMDFGCSFGHLLDQFDDGWTTSGCDVVPALVDHVGAQGKHHVALSVDGLELAAESQGLVYAIDSLYCLSDPRPLLGKLHRILAAEGHLVLRVTNRNQLWKGYLLVRRAMGRRTSLIPEVPHPVAGDAMLSFSLRSLRRLLRESGFEIVTTYRWERKPLSPWVRLRELIALIGHRLTGGLVDLNSGLVVVAKKRPNAAV